MATAGSSNNPPRSPAVTSNRTRISSGGPASSSTGNSAAASDPIGLTEEPPPAYTPSPDVYQGEETIEYGPARPFQPPPRPSVHPQQWSRPAAVIHTTPQSQTSPSVWRQLADHLTSQLTGPRSSGTPSTHPTGSSSWSGYPGHQQQQSGYGPAPSTSHASLQVPHLPPRPVSSASSAPNSPSSDFARDFYAAGTGPEPELHRSAPSSPAGYAPPHGLPPPAPGTDDGRPTQTPTPGHPLLRDGKLLVYPKGYVCEKCHNMGFKHADPSHPCRKCWTKYAKPFQGPLTYVFTSDSSASSGTSPLSGSTFQRSLPSFRPPRQTVPHIRPPVPPPPPPRPAPPPQPAFYTPSHPPPNLHTISPYTPPPRNAIVYPAGDPRIGGRLCWRCDGRGSVSLLIFDSMTCEVCGGIGRVFN